MVRVSKYELNRNNAIISGIVSVACLALGISSPENALIACGTLPFALLSYYHYNAAKTEQYYDQHSIKVIKKP